MVTNYSSFEATKYTLFKLLYLLIKQLIIRSLSYANINAKDELHETKGIFSNDDGFTADDVNPNTSSHHLDKKCFKDVANLNEHNCIKFARLNVSEV